ncbi:hypothetical protein RJ641_007038 [Dillenia turbinata]|uniref:Uncharacterized protein n=1 Tax=Dillenia turbinata TaxID=194707 RepID=A0AAN8VFL1_9MAGN
MEHLAKPGCAIGDNFIKAIYRDQKISGGYVCSEGIHAGYLSGDCHYKRELLHVVDNDKKQEEKISNATNKQICCSDVENIFAATSDALFPTPCGRHYFAYSELLTHEALEKKLYRREAFLRWKSKTLPEGIHPGSKFRVQDIHEAIFKQGGFRPQVVCDDNKLQELRICFDTPAFKGFTAVNCTTSSTPSPPSPPRPPSPPSPPPPPKCEEEEQKMITLPKA